MTQLEGRRRLAVVITDLGTGGAESLLVRLLPRLTNRFDITVHSLRTRGVHSETLESHNIAVNALGARTLASMPAAFRNLVERFRKDSPDIVQTHLYHADLFGGWAARRAGVGPIVWGIHNSGLGWSTMKPATRAVIRACAWSSHRVPDRVVSCSQSGIARHVEVGYAPEKIEFIPNGFDLKQFHFDQQAASAVRRELNVPLDAPMLGMVARLDPQKDHGTFISMAAILNRHRPDVHFILVGQGVDDPNGPVLQGIKGSQIGSVCRLLGRRNDISRLMSSFDVLVSSSIAEAFPLVIGEAMATSVPCVVTDVGDSALIVGDTGTVVPPRDGNALAMACLDLLSIPPEARRALGGNARDRIAVHFDLDAIAGRYADLYERMLSSSGRR